MDKETLSNYGWIVILVLILAVMLALASPFGSFIAGAIKSTTAGLFDVNQAALGSAGIDVNDMVFENCDHLETEIRNATDTYTGDTCCKACGAVLQAGQIVKAKVPEGGKYTAADGTVYNPGDEMPETVTTGDTFNFGHYEYKYNGYRDLYDWKIDENQNGWGVYWIDGDETTAPEMLKTISGKPITNLSYTFAKSKIQNPPSIPSTVTNMNHTFYDSRLVTTPVIPVGVTNVDGAFMYCPILSAPLLPNTVVDIDHTFYGCGSLKTYAGSTDPDGDFSNYVLPNRITSMERTFESCRLLTYSPVIPNGVTNMWATFYNCSSLLEVPAIPNTVTNMNGTFINCVKIEEIPVFHDGVNIFTNIFNGCTGLKTYVGSTDSDGDFSNYIIPSSVGTLEGAFEGCTGLIKAPIVVKCGNIERIFKNCTNLTGIVIINSETTGYKNCFAGVDFDKQNITLTGASSKLDIYGATGINYCAECNGKCQGNH